LAQSANNSIAAILGGRNKSQLHSPILLQFSARQICNLLLQSQLNFVSLIATSPGGHSNNPKLRQSWLVIGNFMATLRLLILFLFTFSNVSAQVDSTILFEESKGTWEYPISNFSEIENLDTKTTDIPAGSCKSYFPIIFVSENSQIVKAVFDGQVLMVQNIDSSYFIMTKYGDYFISYYGLEKPFISKGIYIKKGQTISTLHKDYDAKYRIEINLTTERRVLNPFIWFKSTSCL